MRDETGKLAYGEATATVAFLTETPMEHIEYWALVVINKPGMTPTRVRVTAQCHHSPHAARCLLEGLNAVWGSEEAEPE
jgi:hypothetical protein